jgi:glucose-6-phosphate 1-dehydrogenase
MEKPQNCAIIIFGASGDLTYRKLVPGLFNLYRRKLLPEGFTVLGVSRKSLTDEAFRNKMAQGIRQFANHRGEPGEEITEFLKKLYYRPIDTQNPDDYRKIKQQLETLDREHHTGGNYLFYMSTPPILFDTIVQGLGHQGLQKKGAQNGWKRLVVEKPFGYDLESARDLNRKLHRVFDENQIYRIDHYLGKETVQNMLVFRFANGTFEPLWNRNYIEHVEVTAAENIGVEQRGGYYDGSGALRDMFQNHLLQVVGMVAMEPPAKFNADHVRNETLKVFEALRPIQAEEIEKCVIRGQYTASTIQGEKVSGYREEEGVAEDSKTPTYVSVKFFIDNWRWGGVPFYVRTGKRLPTRVTEVVIHFKQTPHRLFGKPSEQCYECNKLIIRIQPDEGILMKFNMKLPGSGFDVKTVEMDFHYSDLADVYVPEAYERLLLDCMLGDATLYARGDAVEACWKFVDPILKTWESNPGIKLYGYPAGTWGPLETIELFHDPSLEWNYPCSNLAEDGVYCEL